MKKYKVGIIGCGAVLSKHHDAMQANAKQFELVAVCDIDAKKSADIAKKYGAIGFSDYKKMLLEMKGNINLIVVASPNGYHYQQAIDALSAGYDILIEKPVDFSHERVMKIADLADRLKRNAYAVLQTRYSPQVLLLRAVLEKKLLGEIRSVSLIQRWQRPASYFNSWRVDRKIGGRTLFEVGIHYLDIIHSLFGMPTVLSSAMFNNKHKNIPIEDTIFSLVQYPSSASGSIEVTIAAEPTNLESSISVMGSNGYIKIEGKELDTISQVSFLRQSSTSAYVKLGKKYRMPRISNHCRLYAALGRGDGIKVRDAIGSTAFIEEIYKKEVRS